jgi:hypothetical protein
VNNSITDMARTTAAFVAVLATVLAGRSAVGPPVTSYPYAASIRQAARQATSEFERKVLSDGRITRDEYDEAVHRYVACANSRGIPMTAQLEEPSHAYFEYTVSNPSPAGQSIMDACTKGTTALIEPLYTEMVMNPTHTDLNALTAKCLIRKGLAPKSYSGRDFERDEQNQFKAAPYDPNSSAQASRFNACMQAPAQ